MDRGEDPVLVADGTVREEDDLADPTAILRMAVREGRLERRQHLGAAPGLEGADEPLGGLQVLGARRNGLREEPIQGVVEADHREAVLRRQPGQAGEQARLGLPHRGAGHRARIVDDEDDVAGRTDPGLGRRRRERGKKVGTARNRLAEQPEARLPVRFRLPRSARSHGPPARPSRPR